MADGTPFTSGKNSFREGKTSGGAFKKGTGGHTSRGNLQEATTKPASSTSAKNNRIGTLKKRMHGANGTNMMPK